MNNETEAHEEAAGSELVVSQAGRWDRDHPPQLFSSYRIETYAIGGELAVVSHLD